MSELFRKIDEDSAPYPGIRNPIVVYLMSKHSQQVALFYDLSPFFGTFCQAVLQPGDAHKSTVSNLQPLSDL